MPPRTLKSAVRRMKRGDDDGNQVRQNPIGHRLMKGALVPVGPDIELQGLEFDAQPAGTYSRVSSAKSGCPVLGHRQVNSGTRMRMV